MGNKTGKNWHIKIEDMKELFHWDEGEDDGEDCIANYMTHSIPQK
jgi:hypothetical protein